jgi:hypothetical protein
MSSRQLMAVEYSTWRVSSELMVLEYSNMEIVQSALASWIFKSGYCPMSSLHLSIQPRRVSNEPMAVEYLSLEHVQ